MVEHGAFSIVYGTPEAWLKNERWRVCCAIPFTLKNFTLSLLTKLTFWTKIHYN
jgi:hypothetical protein